MWEEFMTVLIQFTGMLDDVKIYITKIVRFFSEALTITEKKVLIGWFENFNQQNMPFSKIKFIGITSIITKG